MPRHRTKIVTALMLARIEQGLTQVQVGRMLGYRYSGQKEISRWEVGDAQPGALTLTNWANALGLDIVLQPHATEGDTSAKA